MSLSICAKCGRPELDHIESLDCKFVSLESYRPEGCKCNLTDYTNIIYISKVCDAFHPWLKDETICLVCNHEKECHKE